MKLSTVRHFFVCLLLVFAASAQGFAESRITPDKLVEDITESLVADIATYRQALEQAEAEPKKEALLAEFYQRMATTLEPMVDFNWLSLNVMGQYRKQATSQQRSEFKDVFARGLVETYGRGLLTYSNQKIVVFPLPEADQGKRKVVVKQEIQGVEQTYPLQYSMGLNRDGEWKVINVTINGINLGQTFRNQFEQAAVKYNGDINQVIANWAIAES